METQLDLVRSTLDPEAELPDSDAGVPDHWLDYLAASSAERLAGLRLELRRLAPYFPHTAKGLAEVCTDAFLVHSPRRGLMRILVRQVAGQPYIAYSRCPLAQCAHTHRPTYDLLRARAPEAFAWVHDNLMDGLVDPYDLTGFVPSDRLYAMSEIEEYQDYDWYDDFVATRDPAQVLEIFSSGGGAYMLLDLNDDLRRVLDPQALRISSNDPDWTPANPVDFWLYLDAWMAIGLAER